MRKRRSKEAKASRGSTAKERLDFMIKDMVTRMPPEEAKAFFENAPLFSGFTEADSYKTTAASLKPMDTGAGFTSYTGAEAYKAGSPSLKP